MTAITQFYADGGDATTIPTNPNHPAIDGGNRSADIPVLGPYFSSAGILSNIVFIKVFPYPSCSSTPLRTWGGVDTIEIFIGCTYSGKRVYGGNCLLSAASADHMVVEIRLESGESGNVDGVTGSGANDYCADASR